MGKFAKISIILFITLLPTNTVFADENEGNFTGGTKNTGSVDGNLNEVKKEISQKEAREKVYDEITNIEKVKPISGGPNLGDGSKYSKVKSLPEKVISSWPSSGVTLYYPIREYRVSFKVIVDSRTFEGKVTKSESGEVAYGLYDQAPALFTRSEITKTEDKDVIGILPTLAEGNYIFKFKVNQSNGDRSVIEGEIPFTMKGELFSKGAGNHRHGSITIPFEKYIFDFSRGLFALLFALTLLRNKGTTLVSSLALGALSLLFLINFVLRNSNSVLTQVEIMARVDTWGLLGVPIAALAMSVSRKNEEKRTILLFATLSTLLAEYSLSLPGGYASLFLITAGVVTGGIYLAHFLDFTNFKPLLFSLYSLIITSAYLIGSKLVYNKNQLPKGFTDNYDFVFSVALLLSVITIIRVVAYKLKNKFSAKFMRYVQFILLPFVIYCISILTDAPGII
jgi:hypothetical protein